MTINDLEKELVVLCLRAIKQREKLLSQAGEEADESRIPLEEKESREIAKEIILTIDDFSGVRTTVDFIKRLRRLRNTYNSIRKINTEYKGIIDDLEDSGYHGLAKINQQARATLNSTGKVIKKEINKSKEEEFFQKYNIKARRPQEIIRSEKIEAINRVITIMSHHCLPAGFTGKADHISPFISILKICFDYLFRENHDEKSIINILSKESKDSTDELFHEKEINREIIKHLKSTSGQS